MQAWLVLIPLISACTGWLFNRLLVGMLFYPIQPVMIFGFTIHGQFPRFRQQIYVKLESWITELLPVNSIKDKVADPANLQKILPKVEEHIDHFLKIKLPQAMPVIAMFVGDKTITQLKAVFMSELEIMFPIIMNEYMEQLESEFDLQKSVKQRITILLKSYPVSTIRQLMVNQLLFVEIMGILGGLLTGLLQVLILLIFFR